MSADFGIPSRSVYWFLAIAFGLAWGVFAPLVLVPDVVTGIFGPVSASNPLFILTVYAPAVSAVILVAANSGLGALPRFLPRLALWRIPLRRLSSLLLGIPAVYVVGAALSSGLNGYSFPFASPGAAVSVLLFMLLLGPVEEFGWRGFALPILQRHMAPLWAALLLGLIWGVRHLPAFFAAGTPQSNWGFTPFLAGAIAISVIMTPMFNATGGSLLWAALFHFQLNNPIWPDARLYDMAIFVAAAVIVVALNGRALTGRDAVVTRVVPD